MPRCGTCGFQGQRSSFGGRMCPGAADLKPDQFCRECDMPYWYAAKYQSGPKFQGAIDKCEAGEFDNKNGSVYSCAACGDSCKTYLWVGTWCCACSMSRGQAKRPCSLCARKTLNVQITMNQGAQVAQEVMRDLQGFDGTIRISDSTSASRVARLRSGSKKTLYHQTDRASANLILGNVASLDWKIGAGGIAGGGAYFAESPQETLWKARKFGVMLEADVLVGNPMIPTQVSPEMLCCVTGSIPSPSIAPAENGSSTSLIRSFARESAVLSPLSCGRSRLRPPHLSSRSAQGSNVHPSGLSCEAQTVLSLSFP
jgi:hypothetical protein